MSRCYDISTDNNNNVNAKLSESPLMMNVVLYFSIFPVKFYEIFLLIDNKKMAMVKYQQ